MKVFFIKGHNTRSLCHMVGHNGFTMFPKAALDVFDNEPLL
jgi:hypothetical protein